MGALRDRLKNELMTGISQVRLAKNIGVSPGTIYKLLYTDSVPKIETLRLVAKYFDVSPSTFASDFIPFELAAPVPLPAFPPSSTDTKATGDIVSLFLEILNSSDQTIKTALEHNVLAFQKCLRAQEQDRSLMYSDSVN